MQTILNVLKAASHPGRSLLLLAVLAGALTAARPVTSYGQSQPQPVWLQGDFEKQKLRLTSGEVEERRDAVMRLGAWRREEAARAVLPALKDNSPIVRVAAASAISSLPPAESTAALIPLLSDLDPFVRQEAAYALGGIHSRGATAALVERLNTDKDDGVRGAAAVALGRIGDEGAVLALSRTLAGSGVAASGARRRKGKENEFVLRAAAHALGEVHSRAAVPALIQVLTNEALALDIKREAAQSLGLIGDPAAISVLRDAAAGPDPQLSQVSFEALRKIALAESKKAS